MSIYITYNSLYLSFIQLWLLGCLQIDGKSYIMQQLKGRLGKQAQHKRPAMRTMFKLYGLKKKKSMNAPQVLYWVTV